MSANEKTNLGEALRHPPPRAFHGKCPYKLTMNAKQIVDLFVEQQVLQPSQVDDVLQEANLNGKNIEQALVDNGFVDERGFYQVIADALGTDFVDLGADEIAPEILRLIPARPRPASSGAADCRSRQHHQRRVA